MKAKDILKDWLEKNGYDGLVCTEVPCGCLVSDLMPCEELCPECKPGHKETVSSSEECGCDGQGTEHWHITDAYVQPGDPELWMCECGAVCEPSSSEWRWNGIQWEHSHGYPIGHVPAIKKGNT